MIRHENLSELHTKEADTAHFLNLAEASLKAKRYDTAAEWLRRFSRISSSLKPFPAEYRYHYLLGDTLLWQGDSQAAFREAGLALKAF